MYTRCPACSTCFRVTDRHLAIAKGKVRCGQCQLVFNAPEHAIDDLPADQISNKSVPPVTQASKTEIKKPLTPAPAKKVAPAPLAPTAKEKIEAGVQPAKITKSEKPVIEAPVFDSNATMIADISALDKNEIENINLDTPKENNTGDVFSTHAYDATNASSVSDIMNEMEGQLSLDIAEPNNNDNVEYNADNEFDFLILKDELDSESEDKPKSKNNAYEDELFDQIDLSDFEDRDVEESLVLEEPLLENGELKNIGQHANEIDVPIQLRSDLEHLQASSQRSRHPLLTALLFVVLLIFSFSQLAFFRAHDLVKQIPASRPLLEAFCETISCRYSGPRDIKQIQLLSRDVRLHPKEKKALLISVAMINNAYFAQPYPDIHIRLSDISGNVVAERIFNAKTYMGKLSNPFLLMKSKTPVHINFEVVDPGKDAVNFEFTFL